MSTKYPIYYGLSFEANLLDLEIDVPAYRTRSTSKFICFFAGFFRNNSTYIVYKYTHPSVLLAIYPPVLSQ